MEAQHAEPTRIHTKHHLEPVIQTARGLIVDTVCKAKSGHTGGPLSSLHFMTVLFTRFLNYDPDSVAWVNRDRFVLSCGHESALLYAFLHLQGFLTLDDLKSFRQLHARTPGHPERGLTPGVETTTGPLGQGFANAVGMAVAEDIKSRKFGPEVIRHHTYVLASDGDMQEGISTEAAELAAVWKLGRLVVYYDLNAQQIDGSSQVVTQVDYVRKFESLGWQVIEVDGHNLNEIEWALHKARDEAGKPSIIIGRTTIGFGLAAMEGDFNTHGVPLPDSEALASKARWGIPADSQFWISTEAKAVFDEINRLMRERVYYWKERVDRLCKQDSFKREWDIAHTQPYAVPVELPWDALQLKHPVDTRSVNGQVCQFLGKELNYFYAGSADLGGSVKTRDLEKVTGPYTGAQSPGRYMAFGVREHAMGAIANGMAAYGGLIIATSTFLVFADYMKPAIRLAAIMQLPVKFVFSHDSIHVGEDGPTHQPVDQLAMLRAIPNLRVYRPADGHEAVAAWRSSVAYTQGPSVLVFTRQKVSEIKRQSGQPIQDADRGAYLVFGKHFSRADGIVFASGSEVSVAVEAAERLVTQDGISVRVVSVPCWELFAEQSAEYREQILMPELRKRIAVEAASPMGWERFVGLDGGLYITMNSFGASGPGPEVAQHFGLTSEKVQESIRKYIRA